MNRFKKYLGDRKFYRSTALITIPIALQSMITIGVNMLDNIMLGKLGEVPLSASTLAVQYITFYSICCMGLGMGASVLVSRFWGMRNMNSLRKTVTLMLRFTVAIGLVFTLLACFIPSGIMKLYTDEQVIIEQGVRYLKWSIPCFILMGCSMTCTIVLRSCQVTTIPLVGSVFAFFINVFANWVFIFGNLGAPRLEIEGAAIGTLISRIFEFCFICGYLLFVNKSIGYRLHHLFANCKDMMKEYFRISIPVLISDALLGLGTNVVAMVMGRIGHLFVAANAITTVTQQLSTAVIQGVSQAGCIVTGHSLGEGEYERAKNQGWTFLIIGLGFGVIAGLFIIGISDTIIGFYNISEETKAIAEQLMRAVGFIVIFMAANSIITKGVLRGGGDTKCLMIADNIFLWVVSIPLGYLAGLYFHLSPFAIYCCLKIDQVLKLIWCVFRLKSGKWIHRIDPIT